MSKKVRSYRFWSSEEDEILKAHIIKNGLKGMKDIQKVTGLNRSEKSCRRRFQKHIRPFLNFAAPLTLEERAQVINLHSKFGNNWDQIANEIPGRSGGEIKYFCIAAGFPTNPFEMSQQQVYVSQTPDNPDKTRKSSILAPASGSPQLPIVSPIPDMNSIAQDPSVTDINSEQSSCNNDLSSEVSKPPLNEQVESDSTDEDSLYGAAKRFLKFT